MMHGSWYSLKPIQAIPINWIISTNKIGHQFSKVIKHHWKISDANYPFFTMRFITAQSTQTTNFFKKISNKQKINGSNIVKSKSGPFFIWFGKRKIAIRTCRDSWSHHIISSVDWQTWISIITSPFTFPNLTTTTITIGIINKDCGLKNSKIEHEQTKHKTKWKESSELLRGLCCRQRRILLRDRLWYTDASSSQLHIFHTFRQEKQLRERERERERLMMWDGEKGAEEVIFIDTETLI
jgi:hypothetical protein